MPSAIHTLGFRDPRSNLEVNKGLGKIYNPFTHFSPQHQAHLAQGMMTSAERRLGATKVSCAGFTNFVYCCSTPATSRPRTDRSRCSLHTHVSWLHISRAEWSLVPSHASIILRGCPAYEKHVNTRTQMGLALEEMTQSRQTPESLSNREVHIPDMGATPPPRRDSTRHVRHMLRGPGVRAASACIREQAQLGPAFERGASKRAQAVD